MVTWTRLSVTLYVHCSLSGFIIHCSFQASLCRWSFLVYFGHIILQTVCGGVIQVEGIIWTMDTQVNKWLYMAYNKAGVDTNSKRKICVLRIHYDFPTLSKVSVKNRDFFPRIFLPRKIREEVTNVYHKRYVSVSAVCLEWCVRVNCSAVLWNLTPWPWNWTFKYKVVQIWPGLIFFL